MVKSFILLDNNFCLAEDTQTGKYAICNNDLTPVTPWYDMLENCENNDFVLCYDKNEDPENILDFNLVANYMVRENNVELITDDGILGFLRRYVWDNSRGFLLGKYKGLFMASKNPEMLNFYNEIKNVYSILYGVFSYKFEKPLSQDEADAVYDVLKYVCKYYCVRISDDRKSVYAN